MPQICDMGQDSFYFSSKEGVLWIFFALKSPTASAGFEPAKLGTKGQHATSRPPKQLSGATVHLITFYLFCYDSTCLLFEVHGILGSVC
jgi:hypothetical protein